MVLPMVYPIGQGKSTNYILHYVHIFFRIRHLEWRSPTIPDVSPLYCRA